MEKEVLFTKLILISLCYFFSLISIYLYGLNIKNKRISYFFRNIPLCSIFIYAILMMFVAFKL